MYMDVHRVCELVSMLRIHLGGNGIILLGPFGTMIIIMINPREREGACPPPTHSQANKGPWGCNKQQHRIIHSSDEIEYDS